MKLQAVKDRSYSPPGCGKTYMAKAIAHEAGVPLFSVAGSEFVEVFVGVGASRMRKLFEKAKSAAYIHGAAIIFIDELDVIGQARQFSFMGGQETNSTLNQLLVNMDGARQRNGGQRHRDRRHERGRESA